MLGYTREKESTSPRIDEYFKAQEPTVSLKDEEKAAVAERGVKVSADGGTSCTEVEKSKVEQRDSVESKPQAKLVKKDDTSLSHEEPTESAKTMSKTSQPHTKTVHKDTKVASSIANGRSKATGRRKRKTAVTTGASDSDFAPPSSG